MWSSDDITIEIDEVDGSEAIVVIGTPAGTVLVEGSVTLHGGVLSVVGAHVQGLFPGALGRSGLTAICSRILEATGARSLVLPGGTRTTGRDRGRTPRCIRFLLSMPGEIPWPVTAIKTIAGFGTSLRRGNETLGHIASGETVAIELMVPKGRDAVAELGALGVLARIVEQPQVDLRVIRQRLALTQAEFAVRFGLELDTLQNWEQGRESPDSAARVLLKVIEQNPEAVDAALAAP